MNLEKVLRLCLVVSSTICFVASVAPSKSLEERVAQLEDMSNRRSVIRLDNKKFQTFVKSTPRNYSIVVMMTALQSSRQCGACKEANTEYEIVANSWKYGTTYSNNLFFAMVDYDEGPDVFNTLRINTAPVFIHFPPKGKRKAADSMAVDRTGFSADAIAKFVFDRTQMQIRVLRPPNYAGALLVLVLLSLVAGLVYFKRNNLEFFYNKSAWATATLALLFTMTSGQMWNHIRDAQFIHTNQQNGEVMYVHPWSDSQLIVETYIVFALNAAVVIGIILLNEASAIKTAVGKRRVVALCGLGTVVFFFSLLLSVFRSKYQGYPYSFLIK